MHETKLGSTNITLSISSPLYLMPNVSAAGGLAGKRLHRKPLMMDERSVSCIRLAPKGALLI
jgi:hypothetical protein